jgi:transposase
MGASLGGKVRAAKLTEKKHEPLLEKRQRHDGATTNHPQYSSPKIR